MKNVTGYDMMKVFWPAHARNPGRRLMTAITLKVLPEAGNRKDLYGPAARARTTSKAGPGHEAGDGIGPRSLPAAAHLPADLAAACPRVSYVAEAGRAVTALQDRRPRPLGGLYRTADKLRREPGRLGRRDLQKNCIRHELQSAFWAECIRDVRPFVSADGAKRPVWRLSVPPMPTAPACAAGTMAARIPGIAGIFLDWGGGLIWLRCTRRRGMRMRPNSAGRRRRKQQDMRLCMRASERSCGLHSPVFQPPEPKALQGLTRRNLKASFDPKGILEPGPDVCRGLSV